MTVKRMYLALLAAAVVAGCVLRLLDTGVAGFNSARGLGETTGGVLALFLVAALFPTIQILVYRKTMTSALSPTAIGMLVLAASALLSYQGIEFQRTLASVPFEAPGCTFSASFPGAPEVKELVVAGGIAVTQANFYGRDTVLRVECLPMDGQRFAPTTETVMTELRKHANRNGLMDVEFDVSEMNGFVRGVARGWKTVAGYAATYEVHLLADGASMMSLTAGGVSSGYPQPGIHEFLASSRRLAVGHSQSPAS
jgi:hypothetical protein